MAELYLECKDPVRKARRNIGKERPKPRNKSVLRRIPAKALHTVILRDQDRCIFVDANGRKCQQSRFTQIHHIRPYSLGGSHESDNLATLCSTHHQAIHEGLLGFKLKIASLPAPNASP